MYRKAIICTFAVGVALAGVVGTATWFHGVWKGAPYPESDPLAAADRLDLRARDVYRALALPNVKVNVSGPGGGLESDGHSCHRRGMRYWADGLSDSTPPSAPHVADVRATYMTTPVSEAEAGSAVERVRMTLTGRGWTVSTYDRAPMIRLVLQPPHSSDAVTLTEYPSRRLQISAHAPCGRYPASTPTGPDGEPELPSLESIMSKHSETG